MTRIPIARLSVVVSWGALVGLAPLSAAAQAPAPKEEFVRLPLLVEGDVADYLAQAVREAIDEELGRAQFLMRRVDVGVGCVDAPCAAAAAQEADARFAVQSQLGLTGPDYALEIDIVDAAGAVTSTVSDVCDTCGRDELTAMATDLGNKARRKLDAQLTLPPTLVLDSSPPGAFVAIDGEPLGTTPLSEQVPAGQHDLTIEAEGYITSKTRVTFVEGVEQRLDLALQPSPPEPTLDTRPGRKLRIAGWALLGAGAAGVASGGALFAVDEREITSDCSGADVDAQGDCRWRWNSTPGAVALTVTGAATLVTGAVLLGLGYGKRKQSETAVRWRPEPTGMTIVF